MRCPNANCGRTDCITSNKFEEETYKKVLHAGHSGQHAGYPAVAAGAMVIAGGMKLWDRFISDDWRCTNCGTTF